jgi:hypothetical protein
VRAPEILSRAEVACLLAGTANRKHHALLMTTYAAGLRVSEVVRLQLSDLHSDRMLIRVEAGKGSKDRYTLLSETLLAELRTYWRVARPDPWLFQPGPLEPSLFLRRWIEDLFTRRGETPPATLWVPKTQSKPTSYGPPSVAIDASAVEVGTPPSVGCLGRLARDSRLLLTGRKSGGRTI